MTDLTLGHEKDGHAPWAGQRRIGRSARRSREPLAVAGMGDCGGRPPSDRSLPIRQPGEPSADALCCDSGEAQRELRGAASAPTAVVLSGVPSSYDA
jgi:hypothetical protein